ncbi:DNA repair protein RecN [Calidifontibacter terrae]
MLQEIRIRDLGIIDDATLELAPGLNVVTGETGAGKTMVVHGLGLLLGRRAAASMVRSGAEAALVEGVLDLPQDHAALHRAVEAGADLDDALLLARSVSPAGRSRAWVGGRNAPIGVLTDIGELVVAVHGQADQWRLQRPDQHRQVLDDFGGTPLRTALSGYQDLHQQWRDVRTELEELTTKARDRALRLDLLTAGLNEIEAVDPQPGEDADLAAEAERLEHLDALMSAAGGAHSAVSGVSDGDAGSALTVLGSASHSLGRASEHDPALAELRVRLDEVIVQLTDVAADLQGYVDDLDADPARADAVNERRAQLTGLLRKYGSSLDEVIDWSRNAAAEVTTLEHSDERIGQLRDQEQRVQAKLTVAATTLTAARRKAATALGKAVTRELGHLAMGSARLEVQVEDRPGDFGSYGVDDVEIRLAANKGSAAQNVAKAASGGELSRVMLAIEVVTASGDMPTFVFDEVDAGVGGSAALDIGARLKRLASDAQVIVVTHLAQVAAYADNHLVVAKQDDGQVTVSGVRVVTGADRRTELARMLGGTPDGAAALAHADELLERVASDSNNRP